jgi:hypothetical protein
MTADSASESHARVLDRAAARVYSPRKFNRRSRQVFTADRTVELVRHLGRAPSYPERLIISRVISLEYELRRLDSRIDNGEELSGHALRARLAAENRLRLDLAALGLKPSAPKAPSLSDIFPGRAA